MIRLSLLISAWTGDVRFNKYESLMAAANLVSEGMQSISIILSYFFLTFSLELTQVICFGFGKRSVGDHRATTPAGD